MIWFLLLMIGRKKRAKMTWTVLFQSFLCGLFGYVMSFSLINWVCDVLFNDIMPAPLVNALLSV